MVRCIGGVGAFLIETGHVSLVISIQSALNKFTASRLTVSMRIPDDDFDYTLETLRYMFLDKHNLVLWALPLFLAILLRVITHKYNHQLIFPLCECTCLRRGGYSNPWPLDFIIIPLLFYIVVAAARLNLSELRHTGWIFDMGASAHEPWYKFYSYFDFGKIRYSALWSTLPTQFAL